MTSALVANAPPAIARPAPSALVLAARSLRPGTDHRHLSRFADDRWNLTHALHEAHTKAVCLDMGKAPEPFRTPVKHFIWLLLNPDANGATSEQTAMRVLAVRTVAKTFRHASAFVNWLTTQGLHRLDEVTAAHLDSYADNVRHSAVTHEHREDLLAAVICLWSMRHHLPEHDRLPEAPPWGGDRTRDILGQRREHGENRTPRIHPATMAPLLSWSLRFIQDFADDILAAIAEHRELIGTIPKQRQRHQREGHRYARDAITQRLAAVLERHQACGRALPGKRQPDGTVAINYWALSRMAGGQIGARTHGGIIAATKLPIDDDCYLFAPINGVIDQVPWRGRPIAYDEAPTLARHLSTACFIAIAYLSGQRPGETLNLRRGCIERDAATGLIFLRGIHFKGVRDETGNTIPEGKIRQDPWVVVSPVADAVDVLQQLHDSDLLFPNTLFVSGYQDKGATARKDMARNDSLITQDITRFCHWVNAYCRDNSRTDGIPADPTQAAIQASRLRRTLAWFIARKPRGLIAAAIQYGHTAVHMALGYAGTYASGFPDDIAFEEWLARLETMAEAQRHLSGGEHVSGPAADTYRNRVNASARFAGRVLRTGREAATLLANPDLQVYQGKGITCVLDPNRAACRLTRDEPGHRHTPDIGNCQPHCVNIARTDRDIAVLQQQASHLQAVVGDPLAPPIRHAREQHELDRIQVIIGKHRQGRDSS